MDAKTALQQIRKGQVSPIYLCYGTEKYQIQQFITLLTEHVTQEEHRDFGIVPFDLSETPIEAVVEEAETIPFLVPKKLILVKDSSVFTSGRDQNKIDHQLDRLLAYMDNPTEYSVIVFIVEGEKLDERKKVVKSMKNAGTVLSFMPLSGEQLVEWVTHQAEKRGCKLAAGAADALIRNAGTQLQTLSAELDKLALYAGQGGIIDVEIVDILVARSTEQNVFVMIEEIANLRLEKALNLYYDLLKQREEPIKIAALISRQFRIMLQVKELGQQSYSQQQIASQIGIHPYAVKIAGEQARKFDTGRLRRILADLGELDYQMKTGAIEKVLGLELFLLKLGA
ncbi:DNA polymerase III subunit delta [Paenibacillus sediminis]|uniref:DNA polymerase III subunit delta n=1 Tax=Paenibacillus sediminis TaxID=664909 RepID=A0ABS4GZQ6_9BACL|nr:DNA polymerase-3 subunit delta [Paenibacillus sediminis]